MPPRRGVGVLWTSRSRMPGYSLYFRLSRQTPHESAEGDGRGEDDGEDVLLHGCVRLLRDPARAGRPAPRAGGRGRRRPRGARGRRGSAPPTKLVASMMVEAMPVADGPASRYTATLSPSIPCASSAAIAGALPVRFALETASGPVSSRSSRAIRCAGIRTATVPWVSPRSHVSDGCDGRTMVSPPGQNSSTSRSTGSGTSATSARSVVRPATRTGGGDCRPRPFASSSRATAARVECVGGDAVHGVGREDDEFAAADGLARLTHAGEELRLITAIEDGGHVGPILDCGPATFRACASEPGFGRSPIRARWRSWRGRGASDPDASPRRASRPRRGSRGSPRPATRRAR